MSNLYDSFDFYATNQIEADCTVQSFKNNLAHVDYYQSNLF